VKNSSGESDRSSASGEHTAPPAPPAPALQRPRRAPADAPPSPLRLEGEVHLIGIARRRYARAPAPPAPVIARSTSGRGARPAPAGPAAALRGPPSSNPSNRPEPQQRRPPRLRAVRSAQACAPARARFDSR
jgi:hypothetical protein